MNATRRLTAIVALIIFASLAVAAQAVHWPEFGGGPGRAGFQNQEQGTLPVTYKWTNKPAGRVRTSPIVTGGTSATTGTTAQRMLYGNVFTSGGNTHAAVNTVYLATGATVGTTDFFDTIGNDDADSFGDDTHQVNFASASSPGAPGQTYVVYNNDDSDAQKSGGLTCGNSTSSVNDIAIAQIDETTGALAGGKNFAVGPVDKSLCLPPGSTGAVTDGYTIQSSPVLSPPFNANGDRYLFFVAKKDTAGNGRLFKIVITAAGTAGSTIDSDGATFKDLPVNPSASPSIAYLADPNDGQVRLYVVVAMNETAGASPLRAYRAIDMADSSAVSAANDIPGTAQTPTIANTSTDQIPGENGTGKAPAIYAAFASGETTTVRKFKQVSDSATLVPVQVGGNDAVSPALDGAPAPILATTAIATGGASETTGDVVVTTGKNLYILTSDTLALRDANRDADESVLTPGTTGYSRNGPAISGGLIYVQRDSGTQQVLRLSDAERVCSQQDVIDANPGCSQTEFAQNEENVVATYAQGQPAISRGYIGFVSNIGVFTYRDSRKPFAEITDPGNNTTVSGTDVPVTVHATDDGAVTQVVLYVDGAFKASKGVADTGDQTDGTYTFHLDSTTLSEGEHLLTAQATDNDNQTGPVSKPVKIIVDNQPNNPPVIDSFLSSPAKPTTGQPVTFTATAHDSDGSIANYKFDLDGDGSFETDSGTNNTATRSFADDGTYTVRVQVRDNEGATAISELTVKIANRPPQPGLSITPNPAAPGQEVTFDASTSSDPDGSIQKYEFDFDGNDFEVQNGTNPVAKHTYAAAGTYDVRVRVTDNDGAAAIGTFHVTVQDAAVTPNKAPSAFVTAAPNPATTAQTVNFDASGSKDSDGTIVKYEWDLDGTGTYETNSGTNPKTSHQYAIAGKYLVTLRVTDNRGATATSQVVLTVTAPGGNNPGRVGVKALSSKVSPKRDARAPYVFKTSGKLTLPSGVTTAKGCNGRVAIQFKRGKKTISSRRTALRSNCTYKDSVTFRDSHRFGTSKSLRVSIKFQGNDVLLPKSAPTRTVRVK